MQCKPTLRKIVFFGWLLGCGLPVASLHATTKHHRHVSHQTDAEEAPSPTPTPEPTPSPPPEADNQNSTKAGRGSYGPDVSLEPSDLKDFSKQPVMVQSLIEAALGLTRQDLTYTYGSSDPVNGGMDCSGFIYHVLSEHGFDEVPRDASGQYVWARKAGTFRAVVSRQEDSFELNEMRPGDLLFWTGTYDSQKDPPVTHTMIYLGREKAGGHRVMVGSSDGRTYHGTKRWGVSVFDFTMPGKSSREKGTAFIGYAHIPGLDGVDGANGDEVGREAKASR
ncbi:MAG: NlpC/P60 family protein [Chthoniobacteraceae bacterium]